MKKIYILFMAGMLALGAASCSKDDNSGSSSNNNNNNNNPPKIDVWARSVGTYKGAVTNGQGSTPNMTVTVTKISDTKLRLTPGSENTLMSQLDLDVFKSDSSLYLQQGSLDGSFYIIATDSLPTMIFTQNSGNISFFGKKQ